MIVAKNLTKRYGKIAALKDVSFTIKAGEVVAFWGANGAGKTTMLRCLLGLQGFEGQLTVNGINVARQSKAVRSAIGYVPQEVTFYDMTVLETLSFYTRLKKTDLPRIETVIKQIQLEAHQHKRVNMLSGGMKQRLALGVALLADPPVLVLDEPTASLDVQAQRDFLHTIQSLNYSGKTVVFSSHRLDEVTALASRVMVLAHGSLVLECPPNELAYHLGLRSWMRIWVNAQHREDAMSILKQQGFSFMPNGHSIYVQVDMDMGGKIAPLRSLEQARIPIEDFDLIDGEIVVKDENHD